MDPAARRTVRCEDGECVVVVTAPAGRFASGGGSRHGRRWTQDEEARLRLVTTADHMTEWLLWVLGPFAIFAIAMREWRYRHPSGRPT